MRHNFVAGQQVVCINDKWSKGVNWDHGQTLFVVRTNNLPVKNEIYRIKSIHVNGSLLLEECPTAILADAEGNRYFANSISFESQNFRPLVTKSTETGMAVLRAIAQTGKLPVKPRKKKEKTDA